MIINLIIAVILGILEVVFNFLPVVTLADIPGIGSTVQSMLTQAVETWNAFMVTFPYAVVVWTSVQIIIGFELLMLVGKFFLGGRMPNNETK